MDFSTLHDEFGYILLWIALFGITDSIINKYVPSQNYNLRIFIFVMIFILSLVLIKIHKKQTGRNNLITQSHQYSTTQ